MRPYLALRHRDFRRLWLTQLFSQTGSQMQLVAIDWHVYQLTHSPLFLGMTGLVRTLPVILFSLGGGVATDRYDRRWIMFGSQSVLTLVAAALALLTFSNQASVWTLYLLTALGASANAFDAPARQSMVPHLVPDNEFSGAVALNMTMAQAASIAGPAVAGSAIALLAGGAVSAAPLSHGLGWIYLANAVSYVGVLGALVTLRAPTRDAAPPAEPPLKSLRAGLRFVFTTPIMVWAMLVDFAATFFSGSMSLIPIFADQILHVGPRGYGWLRAAPAVGALVGSLYTSLRTLPARQGRIFVAAVAVYGGATALFGLSRNFVLSFAALVVVGLADVISTVVRQVLRQRVTPDALRGRMVAVNMIFFMGGPQLGELEAGVVASLFASVALGCTFAVVSGGAATLALAAITLIYGRSVRDYRAPTD